MAATLREIQERAPTPLIAQLLDTAIVRVPLLGLLRWEPTTSDTISYRRRRGTATTPHYSPAGAMGDGADERFDDLAARIRPFGGAVAEPNIGIGFGSMLEGLEAKIIAAGKQFVTSAISGVYLDTTTWTPGPGVPGGVNTITPGPNLDTQLRGSGGVLRMNVAAAVRTFQFMAAGDTGFGTATADVAAFVGADVLVVSANPNLWVRLNVTGGALGVIEIVWSLAFSSTTEAFDSMEQLCIPAQIVDVTVAGPAGVQFDFDHLDLMRDMVPTPGKKAAILAERDFRNLLASGRGLGGDGLKEVAEYPDVLDYRGMYVVAQPGMPTARVVSAVPGCSMAMCIDLDTGIKAMYKSNVPNPMALSDEVLRSIPGATKSWGGLYVRHYGEERNRDDVVTKLSWYTSLMNGDTQGIAMLDGFIA